MGFLIALVLIVLASILFGINHEPSSKYMELKKRLMERYGEPTKVIDDLGLSDESVFIFENPQVIVIKGIEYKFDSILDFSINGGQSYKITTSTGSALGRGIVGGVLLGGVGALAGAGTATKKANPNGTDYLICITTKDLANPMIEYRTKSDSRANELVSILKIILDRTNSEHK